MVTLESTRTFTPISCQANQPKPAARKRRVTSLSKRETKPKSLKTPVAPNPNHPTKPKPGKAKKAETTKAQANPPPTFLFLLNMQLSKNRHPIKDVKNTPPNKGRTSPSQKPFQALDPIAVAHKAALWKIHLVGCSKQVNPNLEPTEKTSPTARKRRRPRW